MADRTFYDGQLKAFADRHRVLAVDLGGHGESGAGRQDWSLPVLGADIKAVADAERLDRVVLFGNSLGGPAVIEAARLLGRRAIGVVGVDTFQDLGVVYEGDLARRRDEFMAKRLEAFRTDYPAAMHSMIAMLFHKDADPALVRQVEARMLKTPQAVAVAVLEGVARYEQAGAARTLQIPIRTINGDLYPTDVAQIRGVVRDFDAIIMPHTGHYPMLEKPEEFNRHVASVVAALDRR
jgi:pimeloyl-ACP methyl ester carboxylesterase